MKNKLVVFSRIFSRDQSTSPIYSPKDPIPAEKHNHHTSLEPTPKSKHLITTEAQSASFKFLKRYQTPKSGLPEKSLLTSIKTSIAISKSKNLFNLGNLYNPPNDSFSSSKVLIKSSSVSRKPFSKQPSKNTSRAFLPKSRFDSRPKRRLKII